MKYKVEIFDTWEQLCTLVCDSVIRCRIDFEGRIDQDRLIQAITLSIRTIPHIGCCFDDSSGKLRWVEKNFTGKDMVRVLEADDNAEEQIMGLLSSGIDFAKEPQLKVFLVRRPEGDTLCVIISHIVCDAAGFKEYLYLLCELYTALEKNEPVPDRPFYTRGTKPLFTGMKLGEKIRILRSKYKDPPDLVSMDEQRGISFDKNCRDPHIALRTIPQEDLARLKGFAKARDATINDMLMALYTYALCRHTDMRYVKLPSTMDLRKFIPAGVNYGISNYSSTYRCYVSYEPGDVLTDILQQVSKQMQAYKTGNTILSYALSWGVSSRLISYASLKRHFLGDSSGAQITFTNLGILDQGMLCFGDSAIKHAYMTSVMNSAPPLLLNVSTFDNRCTLSCNFYGSSKDKEFVNTLLDYMCTEVAALA